MKTASNAGYSKRIDIDVLRRRPDGSGDVGPKMLARRCYKSTYYNASNSSRQHAVLAPTAVVKCSGLKPGSRSFITFLMTSHREDRLQTNTLNLVWFIRSRCVDENHKIRLFFVDTFLHCCLESIIAHRRRNWVRSTALHIRTIACNTSENVIYDWL
jgi:hypothetical protein